MKRKRFIRYVLLTILLFFLAGFKPTLAISNQENVINVITSAELRSVLNNLTFEEGYGNLPISEDIQIIGTVRLSSLQVRVPKECRRMPAGFCRPFAGIDDNYGAEGIKITTFPLGNILYPPGVLTLSDVRLRFRGYYKTINNYPLAGPSFIPVVQLKNPSGYECKDTQINCAADDVCYDSFIVFMKTFASPQTAGSSNGEGSLKRVPLALTLPLKHAPFPDSGICKGHVQATHCEAVS